MTQALLTKFIYVGGFLHFSILIATALVPFRLNWRDELKSLSRLHRQMYWTYGGYIVLSIVAFGCISLRSAPELSHGSPLARGFCLYVCVFWTIRLLLQGIFDVKAHLTTWWLRLGYQGLTVVFACLALIYGWASMLPPSA
jgi:hypothetical protein